jgi:isoamylase
VEGPTDDPQIEALRNRQVKNFLTVTFLSLGVPMILMGDEMRRTQHGNNNAYCRDDADNWLDWTLLEKHADVHRFVSLLAARRSQRSDSAQDQRISLTDMLEHAKTAWHGVKHLQPDWSSGSHSLAFGAELRAEGIELYLIMNAYWEPLEFELPALSEGNGWRQWIDTSLKSPDDIVPWEEARAISDPRSHRAAPRSIVVLWRRI